VDYFVVNVSSPNTPGLRELQDKDALLSLLQTVQNQNSSKPVRKPVFLKIAPDLTNEQLDEIVEIVIQTRLTGIIATNTTISRENLTTPATKVQSLGAGGLSGKPLKDRALEVLIYLRKRCPNDVALVSSGGIMTAQDAVERLDAGAGLVQLY